MERYNYEAPQERPVSPEDFVQEGIEVDHELAARLIGGRATEMYFVPTDPMDDLNCDSCQ